MRLPEVHHRQSQRVAIIATCSPLVAVVLAGLFIDNVLKEEAFDGRRADGHGKDVTRYAPKL